MSELYGVDRFKNPANRLTPSLASEPLPPSQLSIWKGAMPMPRPPVRTMASILEDVAQKWGLTVDDLKGQSRRYAIARHRQEAMWLMVRERRWSKVRIGLFLGSRNHATIIHGVRAHERRMAENLDPDIPSQCLGHAEGGILIP